MLNRVKLKERSADSYEIFKFIDNRNILDHLMQFFRFRIVMCLQDLQSRKLSPEKVINQLTVSVSQLEMAVSGSEMKLGLSDQLIILTSPV